MPPMPTEQGLDANMTPSPQPQGGGLMSLLGQTGLNGDMPPYMGGMLSRYIQQLRDAEGMPSTDMSAPRQLTQEEAMAITSMPATGMRMAELPMYMPPPTPRVNYDPAGPVAPQLGGGIGALLGSPAQAVAIQPMAPPPSEHLANLINMLRPQPRQGSFVDTMPMAQADPNFRFGETPQQMAQNAQGMALGGLIAKYRGGMC